MKTIAIKEDTTIDWWKDYHVYALNAYNSIFENVSDFSVCDNYTIYLDEDFLNGKPDWDEKKISRMTHNIGMCMIDYLLYSESHYLVGFVASED